MAELKISGDFIASYLTPLTKADVEVDRELLWNTANAVVKLAKSEERNKKIQRRERWVKHDSFRR